MCEARQGLRLETNPVLVLATATGLFLNAFILSFSSDRPQQDKELGRGTYGRVIQATHRGTGRQFACKVVHVTRMEPRQVSKLYSEVSVLRELDHPHIVRMRQVFYSKVHAERASKPTRVGDICRL